MSNDAKRPLDIRRSLQEFMDEHAALQNKTEELEKALETSKARVTELDRSVEELTAQGLKDLETIEALRSAVSDAEQKAASCVEASDVLELRRRLEDGETALERLRQQIEEFERVSSGVRQEFERLQQRNIDLESELGESRRQLARDRRAVFVEARERLQADLQGYIEQLEMCSPSELDISASFSQAKPALPSVADIDALRRAIDERKTRGVALQESIDQMNARLAEIEEVQRRQAFDKKPMLVDTQETRIRDWIGRAMDARRRIREEMAGLQSFVSAWELVHGSVPVVEDLPAMPVFSEENLPIESSLSEDGLHTHHPSVVSRSGLIEDLAPKLGLSIEMTAVLALFAVIQKRSNAPHMSLDRLLREAQEAELITLNTARSVFIERLKADKMYSQYFEDIRVGPSGRNPSVKLTQLARQSLEGDKVPLFFEEGEIERFVRIRAAAC